jgi:hypothetical protein
LTEDDDRGYVKGAITCGAFPKMVKRLGMTRRGVTCTLFLASQLISSVSQEEVESRGLRRENFAPGLDRRYRNNVVRVGVEGTQILALET